MLYNKNYIVKLSLLYESESWEDLGIDDPTEDYGEALVTTTVSARLFQDHGITDLVDGVEKVVENINNAPVSGYQAKLIDWRRNGHNIDITILCPAEEALESAVFEAIADIRGPDDPYEYVIQKLGNDIRPLNQNMIPKLKRFIRSLKDKWPDEDSADIDF